jgi:hypothetical protein
VPKIDDTLFTYIFRPFRSNQRLTTFRTGRFVFGVTEGRYRRHGDLLVLIVFAALRAEEILNYCSRINSAAICIDPDQKAELFLLSVISHCGRKLLVILQCGIVATLVSSRSIFFRMASKLWMLVSIDIFIELVAV